MFLRHMNIVYKEMALFAISTDSEKYIFYGHNLQVLEYFIR